MKKNRTKLFEIIRNKYLNNNIDIYLYFFSNTYDYIKGKLVIQGHPFIYVDDNIEQIFNNINKQNIVSNLNPQYRVSWDNTHSKVKKEIQKAKKLIRLNWSTTAIFGPHFNPDRSAQSYNVYTTLYFCLSEIKELIDNSKIATADKINIKGKIFYNIDDKNIKLSFKNSTKTEISKIDIM